MEAVIWRKIDWISCCTSWSVFSDACSVALDTVVSNSVSVKELSLVLCSILIDGLAGCLLFRVFAKYLDLIMVSH
jgi:hypothetical protein